MERWFLLDDSPASGAVNMALDELLLARAQGRPTAPVLRLYSFDSPTITLGFHQDPAAALDIGAVRRHSVDVVRRFTGGRALLHQGELTYCMAGRTDRAPFGGHLQRSHRRLSEALSEALRLLGVDAAVSQGRRSPGGRGIARPCLDSVSRYEVTAGGRKIVASAQRRAEGALLQHGSILLDPSSAGIVGFLAGDWESVKDRVTSVEQETGRSVSPSEMRETIVEAFEKTFGISFEPLALTPRELEELDRRAESKREESRLICGGEVCAR